MADVRGCNIPDELLYWPEKHVWCQVNDDVVTVGVTDVAQSLAQGILSALPKAAGRSTKKGRSLGTIESSKWVGPVTSPCTGEVVESNPMLATDPAVINRDPYGEGWFVRIKPTAWDVESADLVTGDDGIAAYQDFLDAEGISCA